jgi:hypothetical protein
MTWSLDMKHGHAVLATESTCKLDMQHFDVHFFVHIMFLFKQHAHAARSFNMFTQHGQEAWTGSVDMKHGNKAQE